MLVSALRRHALKWLVMSSHSVRQHARYDAQQTPPRPTGDALSTTEAKIKERLEHKLASLVHARDIALRSERVNAIANDLSAAEASFGDLVADSKNDIWLLHRKFMPTWIEAKQLIHASLQDLDGFKREHLLKRKASYSHPLFATGTMALACVGETSVNALLFAQVSRWGAAGGALYSLALSLPNLGLGFLAGFSGLRGLAHVRPAVRWSAAVLTLASFAAAAAWNLYVGHLRKLAELRAAKHQPLSLAHWHDVTAQIFADPAAVFGSPQAILLMAVGVLVFAIATREGFAGFADKYIGYARVDRCYRRAIVAAIKLKWGFFTTLTRLTQHGIDRIHQRADGVDNKCKEGQRILDRARTIIGRFNQRAADSLWVHRAATHEYQALNRRLRDEKNLPARFDRPLEPDTELPDYDWLGMRDKMRAAAKLAAAAADRAVTSLVAHRNSIITDIDNELLDGRPSPASAVPSLPAPPSSARLATEAA